MSRTVLVEYEAPGGGTVLVEMAEQQTGPLPASTAGGTPSRKAGTQFMEALAGIRPIAEAVLKQIEGLAPSQATVEFGVKLTGKAGVVLASAESEGHLKLTLTWTRQP